MSQASPVRFTREPVLNKNQAITANRLIVHAPAIAPAIEALERAAEHWPDRYTVFLSLGRLVPTPDLLEWQFPDNVMVEIPAQTLEHPLTQQLIAHLAEAGRSMCLAWCDPGSSACSSQDWRFLLSDARRHAEAQASNGLALAWGLSDSASFDKAIANGYDGASGWFFLRGAPVTRQLAPAHAQIVRLLNLVRMNKDIADIEAVLKQDVALSYKLLKYINSAGFGLMCEIQSFRHAVTILGYEKLHKWLSLLLVSASHDPSAAALMQTAIARGRFMERIGSQFFDKSEADNLFITGAFSLLDVLLGTGIQTVLEEMHLPDQVAESLIGDDGVYSPFLKLARATESFDATALTSQIEALQLDHANVNEAMLSGLAFADRLELA
ncbi:MAG: HDOD domain-containing protein [Rhodocyclaceae bacterium]|nr:HDOD domain-containing protein [Rhodocyclaceae bacterium]